MRCILHDHNSKQTVLIVSIIYVIPEVYTIESKYVFLSIEPILKSISYLGKHDFFGVFSCMLTHNDVPILTLHRI